MALRQEILFPQDVEHAVEILSIHFKTQTPKLSVGSTRRGWYKYRGHFDVGTISVGFSSHVGIENCLLHEFAHHLDRHRAGRCHGHGPGFLAALRDVVTAWYGSPEQYDWSQEYPSIRAAGPRPKKAEIDISTLLD